jgi:uncharacterized protein (DUF1800 family)
MALVMDDSTSTVATTLLLASALSACGGGGSDTAGTTPPAPVDPAPPAVGYRYTTAGTDAEAARFLQQAQFSSREAEIAAVRAAGYAAWLDQQMAQPVSTTGWDWLNANGYGDVNNPANYYDSPAPADAMVWSQLISAPDAVRKRVALALSEYFVVSLAAKRRVLLLVVDGMSLAVFRELMETVSRMGFVELARGEATESASVFESAPG